MSIENKVNKNVPNPETLEPVQIETTIKDKLNKGSKLHTDILSKLSDCFSMSHRVMSSYYSDWAKAEELYEAVGYEKEEGKIPRFKFPEVFTQIDTIRTYIKSVLFAQNPMFHIVGTESDDVKSAELMETLLDYQVRNMRVRNIINTLVLDALKYNIGILRNQWEVDYGWKSIDTTLGIVRKFEPVYQGNRGYVISPYNYFPDTRVTAADVNDGEFVGFIYDKSLNDLYRGSASGIYFNVDYVSEDYASIIPGKTSAVRDTTSGMRYDNKGYRGSDNTVFNTQGASIFGNKNENVEIQSDELKDRVELAQIEIELVPSDYGISDSYIPEKWLFTIANADTIIQAQQYNCQHGKFSAIPLVPYNDGHSFISQGVVKRIEPYQEGESWLFNAHLQNVSRVLNNMIIVDQNRIMIDDISYSKEGAIIRVHPGYEGMPVGDGIMQLPVQDVTGQHMNDMEALRGTVQKITGANDNFMGAAAANRKTATEVRAMNGMAGSKLSELTADIYEQCVKPWVEQMIANTQQYMNEPLILRIAGKSSVKDNKPIQINREDIQGKFDYVMPDITNPPDRMAELAIRKEIFLGVSQSPELMQTFDTVELFRDMMKKAGVKNIDDFVRKEQPKQPTPEELVNQSFGGSQQPQETTITEDPMANFNTAGESTMEGMMGGIR